MKKKILSYFLSCAVLLSSYVHPLAAAPNFKSGAFLRDAEIESILTDFISPIFTVAGLNPRDIHIYIINNPDLNAAAGPNYSFFLNSGFLIDASNADEIVGVLAHETGHIADGHILNRLEAMERASIMALAAMVLGAAAAAAGSPDAATGLALGGALSAQYSFLHYSRGQEASADQAGVRFLDKLGWSAKGFLSFMKKLKTQDLLTSDQQDGYLRTHPLTSDRVDFLSNYVTHSKLSDRELPLHLQHKFARMKLKMMAFLMPGRLQMQLSSDDQTFEARYARSILQFMSNNHDEALRNLNSIIKETPKDPYLYDLKGQIFYDKGDIKSAASAYKEALSLAPEQTLIALAYAQCLLELGDSSSTHEAFKLVKEAVKKEDKNPFAWQLLAIAYGKQGNLGMSALSLAEKALSEDNYPTAKEQSERAIKLLKDGAAALRAKDIFEYVNLLEKQKG